MPSAQAFLAPIPPLLFSGEIWRLSKCFHIFDRGRRGKKNPKPGNERWPAHRWPGWECAGRATRTFLPCPVGLRPLAVSGPIAAKSGSTDQSAEAGERERAPETHNKCGIPAHTTDDCTSDCCSNSQIIKYAGSESSRAAEVCSGAVVCLRHPSRTTQCGA